MPNPRDRRAGRLNSHIRAVQAWVVGIAGSAERIHGTIPRKYRESRMDVQGFLRHTSSSWPAQLDQLEGNGTQAAEQIQIPPT